ncbi:MAG: long-chain fatty acid--CoA ligase [Acidobacteriota bacterium]|nr:long-chain fatty acid--CoA ligase [Acidobacteriota bacterium]
MNELFVRAAAARPNADAYLSKKGRAYRSTSFGDALRKSAGLGLALERAGIKPGDRVAFLSENREEWPIADYAVMGIGAIDVPLYPTLPAGDVEFILGHSGARGIILSTASQLQKVQSVRAGLPFLEFIICMDADLAHGGEVKSFGEVISAQLASQPSTEIDFRTRALKAKPHDTATIIYTSGTTGQPKGVVLTHANIVSNIKACAPLFDFTPSDRLLSFLPLSHILERMIEYFAFWSGAAVAYATSLDELAQNMTEVRPTIMAVVPRVLEKAHGKILETVRQSPRAKQKLFNWGRRAGWEFAECRLEDRPPRAGLRISHALSDRLVGAKIRERFGGRIKYLISGAAPLSREIAEFFHAMGLAVYEGYGLTETSPVIAVNYPSANRLGTVGPVLPGVEVKLGDEVDEEGKEGREILVRGQSVSPGYYKLDSETQAAFRDGWFHTGDLGKIDADGYLTITGRKKNLFKTSGGKYISPEKIESLFQGHTYVSQMIVLGDKRHFVAALIVPDFQRLEAWASKQGLPFDSREKLVALPQIREFMQLQVNEACNPLAPFERIHQIGLLSHEFSIETGELSPSLKVRRFVVEERYLPLIEEIYSRRAPQP